MSRSIASLVFSLLLTASGVQASSVLDTQFATTGVEVFTAAGDGTQVVGACPHLDGSASIVAARDQPKQWVIARVRTNGTLDTTFSGDGLETIAMPATVQDAPNSVSCIGAGNSDPNDDAMLVAAVTWTPTSVARQLMLTKIDLDQGALDASFGGGTVIRDINSLMMGYDPETGDTDWLGLRIHGLFPGSNGDWLVMGAVTQGSTVLRGFITRFNATGDLQAWNPIPELQGVRTLEVHAARILIDGQLYALARVETTQGTTWGVLRTDPTNLALLGEIAVGGAAANGYALFKGRFVNGGFVIPALAPSAQPFGSTPHLLIVRANQVTDLTLPTVPPLAGETAGASGAMSATIANNGRVIVGMGIVTASTSAAGYYTAMVKLAEGDGATDRIDTDFGLAGAATFRFAPPPAQSQCVGNQAPVQFFSNLSSWGNATLLVGNAAPKCYDEANNEYGSSAWILGARIDNNGGSLFRDSFE